MACWNKWLPCSKHVCSSMCGNIKDFTLQACMPWNMTGAAPYAKYCTWIAGGRKWTDEINVWLNTTYSIHTLYLLTLFILTPIFRHLVGDEPLNDPRWKSELDAGGLNAMDLMNIFTYAHTWCFLSAMWGLTVTMYNPWTGYGMRCCLKPVSAARFFAFWMLVAIVFDVPMIYYHIMLMEWGKYFVVTAIITIYDIIILIPIVHWAAAAAVETGRKLKEEGKYPEGDKYPEGNKVAPEA